MRQTKRLYSSSDKLLQGHNGPLKGIKVLEVGNFIAGPLSATLLGYYGAEVIKIESPVYGDQLRAYRDVDQGGTSFWWRSLGRNKKSVCLDLKQVEGQEIVKDLVKNVDVFVENFIPRKLKKFGLDYESVQLINPDVIYSSVSGYGQTGPYRNRPGFASVCEAMGGFRYVNGFKDEVPVRPNLSIGDTLASMNSAFGIILALLARERNVASGQQVDTSIYESVFQLMEGVLPDYSAQKIIREPSGTTITGIVPSGTYKTMEGKSLVIGANSNQLFSFLCNLINDESVNGKVGMRKVAERINKLTQSFPEVMDSNTERVVHEKEINSIIDELSLCYTAADLAGLLDKYKIPNGLIYSIEDIYYDEHYRSREMFEPVEFFDGKEQRQIEVPALGTKLEKTPGKTLWAGPELGEHTEDVLKNVLGFNEEDYKRVLNNGVVFGNGRK
eukprot:maker-scaffold_1-snap-gene-17.2-mRNA-1 protein AED:0.02 eAED:0.02 QI:0/0/0.5/1/0/0.5/2/10/442